MCSPPMENARAKAPKRKKPIVKPTVEAIPESSFNGDSKFARALGSSDGFTRERGLQALAKWLSLRQHVSDLDMRKIWKGLFYAFWHSDKAPVQAALAARLSAILLQLSPDVAHTYFTVFFRVLREEWFGIDRLRLDKYMLLIRHMLRQMFRRLHDAGWPEDEVVRCSGFLTSGVLVPTDSVPAVGVTYHVIDCWLPELRKAAASAPTDVLAALLEPIVQCAARTPHPACLTRLTEGVFEPLMAGAAAGHPELKELDVDALAKRLFDFGALASTCARNREVLYSVSKGLLKSKRKRQKLAHAHHAAANQSSPSVMAAASSGDAAGPGDVSSAADAADAAQPSHVSSQTATSGEAAGTAEPREAAAPVMAAPGSNSKRKRKKVQQQQVADTNGGASQHTQPAIEGVSIHGVGKTASHCLPGASVQATTPAPSLGQRVKQSSAEPRSSAAPANGTSSAAPEQDSRPSAQQEPSVLALSTPREQTSPRASSKRKSVRFHLRDNLFFEPGGQVPPAAVRTPPKAQPKGSALKVKLAADQAPRKEKTKLRPRSPRSIPRAVAASFF